MFEAASSAQQAPADGRPEPLRRPRHPGEDRRDRPGPPKPEDELTEELLASLAQARRAQRERIAAANLKRVAAAGIPIAMGTDAGNPLTLHGPSVYAEMEAMQAAGLTPHAGAGRLDPRRSARAMGREKEIGTVEKGKLADLLIVGADPTADVANLRQVRCVIRGGAMRLDRRAVGAGEIGYACTKNAVGGVIMQA